MGRPKYKVPKKPINRGVTIRNFKIRLAVLEVDVKDLSEGAGCSRQAIYFHLNRLHGNDVAWLADMLLLTPEDLTSELPMGVASAPVPPPDYLRRIGSLVGKGIPYSQLLELAFDGWDHELYDMNCSSN